MKKYKKYLMILLPVIILIGLSIYYFGFVNTESKYREQALSCYPRKGERLLDENLINVDKRFMLNYGSFFVGEVLSRTDKQYKFVGNFCNSDKICDNATSILILSEAGATSAFANIISKNEYFDYLSAVSNIFPKNNTGGFPLCIYKMAESAVIDGNVAIPIYVISQPQTHAFIEFIDRNFEKSMSDLKK